MTALVGGEVKRTFSPVRGLRGVAGEIFGGVAAKPHEASRKDDADFLQLR